MNHEELTRINAQMDVAIREENRRYAIIRENAEVKHRELVQNENDRFGLEMRRLKAEHNSRKDELIARKDEARIAFARERDREEERANGAMFITPPMVLAEAEEAARQQPAEANKEQ